MPALSSQRTSEGLQIFAKEKSALKRLSSGAWGQKPGSAQHSPRFCSWACSSPSPGRLLRAAQGEGQTAKQLWHLVVLVAISAQRKILCKYDHAYIWPPCLHDLPAIFLYDGATGKMKIILVKQRLHFAWRSRALQPSTVFCCCSWFWKVSQKMKLEETAVKERCECHSVGLHHCQGKIRNE